MLSKQLFAIAIFSLVCVNTSYAASGNGADVEKALNDSYSTTPVDCGAEKQPAFFCSGVLLRGTDVYSDDYHAWDPSPASQQSHGVSFSWLRKDAKFNNLAYSYNNGFIFYPFMNAPASKYTSIDIMCAFPIDGATEYRNNSGCGASSQYPDESELCQSQGITTAEQWHAHYLEGNRSHLYQCGFETRASSGEDNADAFYQTIRSMALLGNESFNEQNELRLRTWDQGMQATLPIQAFFYLSGTSGLSSAQNNQLDLMRSTNNQVWVPVIELRLPSSPSAEVKFIFNQEDQAINLN